MTLNDFYQRYGWYIYQAQKRRNMDVFPYVNADQTQNNFIPMLNPNITKVENYHCYGYNYTTGKLTGVFWTKERIAYYSINPNVAAISFQFAGCYMAKFKLNNQWFICHIHSTTERYYDRKGDWNCFVRNYNLQNLVVFKPTTVNDDFYSPIWLSSIHQSGCFLFPNLAGIYQEFDAPASYFTNSSNNRSNVLSRSLVFPGCGRDDWMMELRTAVSQRKRSGISN